MLLFVLGSGSIEGDGAISALALVFSLFGVRMCMNS